MSEALEQAEQTANRIRGELLRTLEELDRRRELATDVRYQAKRNWPLLAGLGAAAVGVLAARLLVRRALEVRERARAPQRRAQALARAWEHQDRLALPRRDALVIWGARAARLGAAAIGLVLTRRLVARLIA